MRVVIIAALAMTASGLAQPVFAGSSIKNVATSTDQTPSVLTVTCASCPPLQETRKAPGDTGQTLAQGTQKIETRTVNGKPALVRTEAWLGGSPVVFINKQAGWLDNGSQLAGLTSTDVDGIDTSAETAAVGRDTPRDDMMLRLK